MSNILMKEKKLSIHQTTKPRILLVFNNELTAASYKSTFADLGCEPTNAWTPDHAIELFQSYYSQERNFDLVCMDYILPGMNGITLARHLNAIDSDILLHLLPSVHQYESVVLEEFEDFGQFLMEPSDSENIFFHLLHLIYIKRCGA